MALSPKAVKTITDTVSKAVKKASEKVAREEKKPALPLDLVRAKPKTKQEIIDIADRVARQQSGEFIRKSELSGKADDTANLAGRSAKEVRRLKDVDYTLERTKDIRPTPTYESEVGDLNIAIPGDQTIADFRLVDVNGRPIDSVQQGGSMYGEGKLDLDDPLFWASEEGIAQILQDKITKLAQLYNTDRVTAYHLAMGQDANNFAMHFADANLKAIANSDLSPEAIEIFNAAVREGPPHPKTGKKIPMPHFAGIENPEEAYLQMMENPMLRKWFNNRMKVDKVTTKIGLPSGKDIQWAITEPALRDMEISLTGHSVGRMKPFAELTDTADHATYGKGIQGESLGRAPELAPFEMAFPDADLYLRSVYDPSDLTGTIQKVFPHQKVDQQQLDQMSEYYRRLREIRGFKKGGKVDLEAEFRKADMIAPQHFDEGGEAEKPQRKIELEEYIQQENLNTLLQELAKRIQLSGEMAQSREGKQAFGRLGYRQPIGDDMSVGVGASGHYFKGDRFKNADVDRADMSLSKRFKDESELRARLGANLNEQMGKRGLDELMLEYEIPFKDGGNVQHFGPGGLARGAKKIADTAKKATAKALERQKTEYELAHELAQKRAALPVEEGGLGLPPDNTAMDRARALGFNVDKVLYHGSPKAGFREFDTKNNAWFSDRFDVAASYGGSFDDVLPENLGQKHHGLYNVYLRTENPMVMDWKNKDWGEGPEGLRVDDWANRAKRKGHDSLIAENIGDISWRYPGYVDDAGIGTNYAVFDPRNIRSIDAAFDPFKRNESDILAGLMALPAIELLGDDKKPSKSDKKKVKGYKDGGDLEEEFRKADMIDMSGFRQDPLEKATRRADNRPKKQSSMSELNKRLNIAKEVGAELADEFKQKSAKEVKAATRSPKGAVDLLRNIASQYAAMAEDSPIIPTLTGSSQNELAKLALTAMKGKKALEQEYANRKPSDLMGKELSAYDMKTMGDGMLSKAIMGDAEPMPIVSTIVDFASPFAGRALAKGAKAIAPDVMRAIEKATVDPYKFNIVKPEGGQFIDSTLKENLKELKQGGEDNQINKALDSWVDSTLRKYVVNRMGTESDEVRKLFDKGITHVDPEQLRGAPSVATLEQHRARLPGSGKRAETEVGQAWEDASDYSLYGRRRSSYDDRDVEKYPWLSKMAPEDMVYGASIDSSALKDRLGFGHVIDVIRGDLRSGKLRPEQLNKVSVEDAIKRTHAFNQEMAKKAEETAITVQSGMPVHREYPEGYKWVELKHPDAKKTEEMLAYEGDTMGHCVGKDGNYCDDVMSGQARIFSLRDAKGEPHVTIEVQPEKGVVYSQMADLLGEKEVDRLLESGISPREIVDAHPELQELRTFRINQIKGKGNAKPLSKYIPFVQDFVKNPVSGKEWADVRDFHNTDLLDARKIREHGVMPDADTETMNAVIQELDRIYPMNRLPGGQAEFSGSYGNLLPADEMMKAQLQDLTSPYLTKEDIINHLRSKEALPVEQSYSKYYENLPKDEGMAHGGDVHMAKGGFMGAVETAGKLGREGLRRFNDKLNKLSRNVAYNTYEQVPYVGAKHLEGMTERPFGEKLFFTEEAPWGSPEKDADLLAKYLGLESGPSQKGVGLYQPPIEGAPLEFNPQISSRTLVKSDKGRYNENLIAEPDKASMTALGATRGYLDVQGASPWVRPSQGSGRLYNGFHISLNGKPTEEEMRKIGEIQARYGFWGAGDLGKSGVYVGFNPDMTRADLNKMQRAFRKDIKEALGDRVAGVKMMKSEGDYPAFEEAWKAPQGTGTVTRQLMDYLDTAKEKNPLLAEYYAQKPSTELQKLMQEMNIRDIKAPEKYGVGAPREDVMKARDIFAEYGIEGLRDALNRGEYLPAAVAIPSGIELFKDDN